MHSLLIYYRGSTGTCTSNEKNQTQEDKFKRKTTSYNTESDILPENTFDKTAPLSTLGRNKLVQKLYMKHILYIHYMSIQQNICTHIRFLICNVLFEKKLIQYINTLNWIELYRTTGNMLTGMFTSIFKVQFC